MTAEKPEFVDAAIARQQHVKHVSVATDTHAIIEELSEAVSESESELLYDWRFTANQFVLAPSPLRLTARIFFISIEHLRS
jgi:hypothetical protein